MVALFSGATEYSRRLGWIRDMVGNG